MALNMKCSRLQTVASKNVFNNCTNQQKCGAVKGPHLKASALKGLKNCHRIQQRPPIFALKECYTTDHFHIIIIVN